MESKTFTRQQLHRLVWERPVRDIARELGISDVGLAKACRRLAIPMPGLGYWARRAAGQKLTIVALPAAPHVSSQWTFRPHEPRPRLGRIADAPTTAQHTGPAPAEPISLVLSTLDEPHPVVRRARTALERQRPDQYGLCTASPVPGVMLRLAPASILRGLAILDTLLRALGAAVVRIPEIPERNSPPAHRQVLRFQGEDLRLTLRETHRKRATAARVESSGVPGAAAHSAPVAYEPTGRIALTIDNAPAEFDATWRDGKARLEAHLPEATRACLALPAILAERRRLAEDAARRRREAEAQRWQEDRRRARRRDRQQELVQESERYRVMRDVLAYLDQLEARALADGRASSERLQRGLAQARALAQELDPTAARIDSLCEYGLVTQHEVAGGRWGGIDWRPEDIE